MMKRFWDKVNKTTDCWLWAASCDSMGYGLFWDGRHFKAHRYAYELEVGPIPEGLELDHLCRVRHCVNPDHLEPVTHAENMARGFRAMQTHCKRGHPLSGDNLLTWEGETKRQRGCRECDRLGRLRRKTAP